jgi:hypothetical protein
MESVTLTHEQQLAQTAEQLEFVRNKLQELLLNYLDVQVRIGNEVKFVTGLRGFVDNLVVSTRNWQAGVVGQAPQVHANIPGSPTFTTDVNHIKGNGAEQRAA